MRTRIFKAIAAAALTTSAIVAVPASALVIDLRDTGGVSQGTEAFGAFRMAANFWESVISTNVTVKLNVGYSALNPGVLGSTGSTTNGIFIDSYQYFLAQSGNSQLDAIAAANYAPLSNSTYAAGRGALDAIVSGPKANGSGVATNPTVRTWDNDGSLNNTAFSMNTSVMKAIGLTPTYTGANASIMADGSITFSTGFQSSFDFNPLDGIGANQFDFVAIAIHEIGHALGFRSGVDVYDINTNFGGDLDANILMTQLDMFRYSANPGGLGGTGPKLDWAIGGTTADGYAPYFSIDGGQTALFGNTFSTGRNFGDGQQASHWKDAAPGVMQLGLLDPTAARGQQGIITGLDLAAYDAIGWNLNYDVLANPNLIFSTRSPVPEPATWAMMMLGFGAVGFTLRRGKTVTRLRYA